MERKNMVLLTVIAVATLLVAVVGATFAYFTAATTASGETSAEVETSKLVGATVTFASDNEFERLDYPGGLAVYGAKATIAKKPEESSSNDYQATFNLQITYTNQTQTDLTWELYVTDTEYDELDAAETTSCELKQYSVEGETQFWYADNTESDTDNTKSCTGTNISTKLSQISAKKIASGKLLKNQSEAKTITKDTPSGVDGEYVKGDGADLSNRLINTKNKPNKYYYLVVKYPNDGTDQSEDAGNPITVKLSIEGPAQVSLYTEP